VKIIVVNYQTSPPNVNILRLFAKQNIIIAISMKNKDVTEYLRKKLHALGSPSRVPIKGFSDYPNPPPPLSLNFSQGMIDHPTLVLQALPLTGNLYKID
jgi:hypothetical protein